MQAMTSFGQPKNPIHHQKLIDVDTVFEFVICSVLEQLAQ